MLRNKIMLGIVATVVLIGAANLNAQERKDRPEARARQRQKGWTEQPRRQRADREAVRELTEQVQQQRATKEARRKRTENLRAKPQPVCPGQNQAGFPQGGVPAQPGQMFGRWLDELTKAYRASDREKMGQLLRKIHELRQKRQKVRGRGFQGRGIGRSGPGMPPPPVMEKREPHEDMDRPSPPIPRRDMGRRSRRFQGRSMTGGWCRGFQGRGIRRWGRGWQGRDIGRWGQSFQGRNMTGRWDRGFQGRGIGRPGPGMPPLPFMEKPEPPEDVDRPSAPMPPQDIRKPGPDMPPRGMSGWGRGLQRRGMGRWGRGFQRPWCPWLRFPRPETD